MIDTKIRLSPGWRLARQQKKLEERRRRLEPIFARYEGNAPVPESLAAAPDAAKVFFRSARTQFAEMIVKAVKYPLRLQSIGTAADQADVGDLVANQLFVTSGMASEYDDVHRVALTSGNGYAWVSLYKGEVSYTQEDPRQVVTIHDPVRQSIILESSKRYWSEEEALDVIVMFVRGAGGRTEDTTWTMYRATHPNTTGNYTRFNPNSWDWDESETYGGADGKVLDAAYNVTGPIFRYRNEEGISEFERHIPLLDRLDHMVLQGMTIATFQAFKQRAIMVDNKDMPDEDADGEEIDYDGLLASDPGAVWKLPMTAKVWESGAVDLTPVWTGVEKATQQLSAVTFTPLAVFSPEGQNQSAAGAGFAREGRTFKIEDRHDRFGPVHARALSLMFRLAGDEKRAELAKIHIQWRPAERYTLSEKADALVKYKGGGVPWRTRMEEVGQFSPHQIETMANERMQDEVLFPSEVQATAAQVS